MRLFLTFVLLMAITAAGCASVKTKLRDLPHDSQIVRGQLEINTDFALPPHDRLIDELAAQRDQLATKLGVKMDRQPIRVYLFDSEKQYRRFITREFPNFPDRRAFFVESPVERVVYAHWSDRVAEDLRHEVAHGFLHAAAPQIPLWLDEGLAEYFEVGRDLRGMNRPHVELLCQGIEDQQWRPDLARLERLASVSDMTQTEYAEAWAWAYWLLETETKTERRQLLQEYLRDVREHGSAAAPLSGRIAQAEPAPEQSLVEMLKRLR